MELFESLNQAILLVGILIASLLVIELAIYWLFSFYKKWFYLPINLLASLAIGFSLASNWGAFAAYVAMLVLCLLIRRRWQARPRFALMLMAPAFVVICAVLIYPFFFQIRLAFSGLNMYSVRSWLDTGALSWVGWDNFIRVFTSSPLQTASFWELLLRTFVWTASNVVFHVLFGLGLALILNKGLFGKGWYRTLLIIPWAMPQVVAVLAWRGEFHPEFGIVNHLLNLIGIHGINWFSDPTAVFVSCCLVNIWLGIPFMMIVFLGGLQSIPKSYYEAASVDGASRWQQFWQITLPMLKPVVVPSVTLGTIWTFNNVNVIYLMTGQDGGNEFADILVTALYKSAFTYSRFSFSAAFALVIFAILMAMTTFWILKTRDSDARI